MWKWAATVLIAACLAASSPAQADEYDLVVITPHNAQIQEEFGTSFSEKLGRPVKIRWVFQGTGQLMQMLETKERSAPDASFDMDVFFGGGPADHEIAAQRKFLTPAQIEPGILSSIPPVIGGFASYDDRKLWFTSAVSAFGILVNDRASSKQGLPPIQTWADLAHPRMFSWACIADPRRSASVLVCYEAVLQQYGWNEGWPYLMQIAANSRVIADSSSGVPNEIATGNALAGPCVDFYAYARIDQAGADTLKFVLPKGGAAMTPDPISMLRKPPHPELATKFMNFILSPEGQRLWCMTPPKPGGPKRHKLYRTPCVAGLTEPSGEPITGSVSLESVLATAMPSFDPKIQRARVEVLSELMGAALVDQHQDLAQAWKAIIDGGMKETAMAEWKRLPFEESQSEQLSQRLGGGQRERRDLIREWRQFFSEKFERVQELSR